MFMCLFDETKHKIILKNLQKKVGEALFIPPDKGLDCCNAPGFIFSLV